MGKRSVKTDKTIYQIVREEKGLTRAQASMELEFISESRLERIELNGATPYPDEVIAFGNVYKSPELCRYYCSGECPIGQKNYPPVSVPTLSEIVLGLLNSMNTFDKNKDRLIEITADGKISDDELFDFQEIRNKLQETSNIIESLKLWFDKNVQ